MFPTIDKNESFPARELAVGEFWRENDIYHKSLAAREGAPPFVFYEGPPTANGMPHPGHCLTRAIKDLFPRYKTMRGYRCDRKAGWDTHGLPVEVEVCKEMGIHSKEEIEAFGIEPFIQKCQQSVWRYMQEWRRLTERLGFWVDLDEAYVTYHQSYVESVWWSLKTLFDRGLLYRGHKIVWWWAQGGTALSAGEVGQGYREVADPSVYVKFPLLDDDGKETDTSLLVWTTTPWTLPSNQFTAVHPDIEYTEIEDPDSDVERKLIVALDCVATVIDKYNLKQKKSGPVEKGQGPVFVGDNVFPGKDLIGRRYKPPFDCFYEKKWVGVKTLHGDRDQRFGYYQGRLVHPNLKGENIEHTSWRVVGADFVTTDSGTGIVHQAPAFGEVDYDVLLNERERFHPGSRPQLINCVGADGKFLEDAPEIVRNRWVKDCDKDIIRYLKTRGLLFHQEQYLHDYPFCWRAEEDPLIQYPRESWFVRTTEYKDQMLANNAKINWLPEHIKEGRFGKFLESNVDWALSRERYWGTPLPIWVCDETGKMEAVESYEELLAKPQATGFEVWEEAKQKNPDLPDDLRIHKPYIDAVIYESPFAKGARMRRVTEVIDCWYDSGAMPFAQWGYRGQDSGPAKEQFESQFPADFISEALDQTRGWFYSQLAISTLMFGKGESVDSPQSPVPSPPYPHPFKNCIVLGLMLGEDGQKMSKSKRNYREPNEIFDKYGADALRWYLFANQPPWTSIRYSEDSIKDSIPEFLLRLWNVYSFFTIYGNIDEFDPAKELGESAATWSPERPVQLDAETLSNAESYRPIAERSELDRWILSELNAACAIVVERMDAFDNFGACQAITSFIDGLSNWYVRRSRDRFWAKEKRSTDKLDAYWTLYECLLTTTKLTAPFVPFLAERLWQDLAVFPFKEALEDQSVVESVHLCDFPVGDASAVDQSLSEQMDLVRLISSLGRQARSAAELKVRQPLSKVEVILADTSHQAWLEDHAGVIAEELNVKAVEFSDEPEKYVDHEVVPNFKLLGPKLGKLMPKVKGVLAKQSGSELLANIQDNGQINIEINGQPIALTAEEVEFRIQAKPGWTSANDKGVVVVLATEVTPELLAEGWIKDFIRLVQDRRKEIGCEFTDRIEIGIVTDSADLQSAIETFLDRIRQETLSVRIVFEPLEDVEPIATKIGDADVELYLRVSS
ncbi:isoleucine--tRNA ligase [Bythopirellula goksoeyrii]|uniref:Isoleucine--tRNA ligase n=1 Tax=Bythopirellula goksoeyrii TaxID=1400387 RepID=A0A5B9QBW6_9BACT|nr:isoleucine--tRNA ligase [Bythopirellula goksoeyrii]QEG35279.1 Isoleucine--tRNA ligase [Bythopirellula goksoeyrii]